MLKFDILDDDGRTPSMRLDAEGRLQDVDGVAAIRQSLRLLLATRPGERVERPEYGCDLDQLAFEPNDGAAAGLAMRLVADAVARFERRAEIVALDAGPDPDAPSRLLIELSFRDVRSGAEDQLAAVVDLEPGS